MRAIDPEAETNLDFLLEITLETGPDDLALTRLQPICHRWYGSNVVRHGEQNQLVIDEVRDRDLPCGMVQESAGLRENISQVNQRP